MPSKNIPYEMFITYFPQYASLVESWYPQGKYRIRIRLSNGENLAFHFVSHQDWRLESEQSYMTR